MSESGSHHAGQSAGQDQPTPQGPFGTPGSTESRSIPKEITGYVVIETSKGGEISTDDD
jgi:hypothetical protein